MFHESPMGQGDEPSSARHARSRVARSKTHARSSLWVGREARPYAHGRSVENPPVFIPMGGPRGPWALTGVRGSESGMARVYESNELSLER